ncbi:MAG TPA: vitamin K epoxide reductase family protein [Gaiellaceae bacterium]
MSDRALRAAITLLALAGAGIAAYLTWVHYHPGALVCLSGGGCETVQKSRYSELVGIPVALLGLVSYVVLGASAFVRGVLAAAAAAAIALAGLVFALWLVYVQAAILDAWCNWCVASDVVLALLTVACVVRVWRLAAPAQSP